MSHVLSNIKWMEMKEELVELLKNEDNLSFSDLPQGLEAEVVKVINEDRSYVLKVWNKGSRPEVKIQYQLLDVLSKHNVAVSKPLGWGVNKENHQVLLTSFDGAPVQNIDNDNLSKLVQMIHQIHEIDIQNIEQEKLLNYDFITYFHPNIDQHEDIYSLITELVEKANLTKNCIIHGDYHLGNILENEGQFTIIDWTNGQLGDPRYDMAWAILLMRIYVGERFGGSYRKLFLMKNSYTEEELELFEAIACLRWISLHRIVNMAFVKDAMKRVRNIIENNKYLTVELIEK